MGLTPPAVDDDDDNRLKPGIVDDACSRNLSSTINS